MKIDLVFLSEHKFLSSCIMELREHLLVFSSLFCNGTLYLILVLRVVPLMGYQCGRLVCYIVSYPLFLDQLLFKLLRIASRMVPEKFFWSVEGIKYPHLYTLPLLHWP